MIDWFVVLIPLLLVPIFALFVFVGCVLDREGKAPGSPITFSYPAGLDSPSGNAPGLSSIVWQYNMDLDSDLEWGGPGQIGGPTSAGPFERGAGAGQAIDGNGETHSHMAYIESEGPVTCSCTLVTKANPPFDNQTNTINLNPVTKQKIEDETGPGFVLSRSGTGFTLS